MSCKHARSRDKRKRKLVLALVIRTNSKHEKASMITKTDISYFYISIKHTTKLVITGSTS